jgi:hypothetical protein
MAENVHVLPGVVIPGNADPEIQEAVENLLSRVRSGDVVALGYVEVYRDGKVAIGHINKTNFHELNSGAAWLAHSIVSRGEA